MKYNSLLLLLFLIGGTNLLLAQKNGVQFEEGTWEETLAKARKNNKPIFVDAYTVWCGPCKWMAKNVFTDEVLGESMNREFISYKMNMESKEGVAFGKKHKVMVYPTLLYLSPEGELMHKGTGARDVEGLIALNSVATDPSKQIISFHKKYESGNTDKAFLKNYLEVLQEAYEVEKIEEVFGVYWKGLSMEEKVTRENLEFIGEITASFENFMSPYTQFFLQNRPAYKASLEAPMMEECLSMAKNNGAYGISTIQDKRERKALLKMLLAYFPNEKKEIKAYMDYLIAQQTATSEVIAKKRNRYLKLTNEWDILNAVAWEVFEQEDDTKMLKMALGWINRSIGINSNAFNLDTKANLLYKMKEYVKAKEVGQAALKAAKDTGDIEDTSDIEQLLEQIEGML